MNDSADRAKTDTPYRQAQDNPIAASMEGLTSLSDWAEFSSLIRKLDVEYAETMAAPLAAALQARADKPKSAGS